MLIIRPRRAVNVKRAVPSRWRGVRGCVVRRGWNELTPRWEWEETVGAA